jgi:hypothetical protein
MNLEKHVNGYGLAKLIPHLVLIRPPGFALNVAIGSPLFSWEENPCQLGIGQLSRVQRS